MPNLKNNLYNLEARILLDISTILDANANNSKLHNSSDNEYVHVHVTFDKIPHFKI